MKMPGEGRPQSKRGHFGLALCLLLPPLGLLFLWRKGVFRTRGRVLVTVMAALEMAVLCVLMMPEAALDPVIPPAGVPSLVTRAPESEVLTALSNIDAILKEEQLRQVIESGGTEDDLLTEEEKTEQERLEQEAILNTIVYSVYDNARYYHAAPVCGNQSNRQELTVKEARGKALAACPDCNPPVYTGN